MRKSLDSHVIEEMVYFANEKAKPKWNQIRPSLSDFKVEELASRIYCLTPKFTVDQKPGGERAYYSFVKAILEFGDYLQHEMKSTPYTIYFAFPFPKGNILISEVDDELGELSDNTDVFTNTTFDWLWEHRNIYSKDINVGKLSPAIVITRDGFSSAPSTTGYFGTSVNYMCGIPFVDTIGYTWEV